MTPRAPEMASAHRRLTASPWSRWVFMPAGWLWQGVAASRRWLYQKGVLPTDVAAGPVVGVGNLALGGAGKTPVVMFLAQYFGNHGKSVAIVSRGYGRDERGQVVVRAAGEAVRVGESSAGDEPLMLARALPQATVLVGEDRASVAARAFREFAAQIVVLDDAFQFLKLKKDLDILLLDARRPPGPVFPAGHYREGIKAARAAGLIVLTKCGSRDRRREWHRALDAAGAQAPRAEAEITPAYLRPLHRMERVSLKTLEGAKVLALAGVADFEGFVNDLTEGGAVVARRRPFADHHRYSHAELADAEGTALVAGCDFIVTTAKDEARLEGWRPAVLTYVLEQSLEIVEGFDDFNQALDRILNRAASR